MLYFDPGSGFPHSTLSGRLPAAEFADRNVRLAEENLVCEFLFWR